MHILFLTDNFPPETNAPQVARSSMRANGWRRVIRSRSIRAYQTFRTAGLNGYRNRLCSKRTWLHLCHPRLELHDRQRRFRATYSRFYELHGFELPRIALCAQTGCNRRYLATVFHRRGGLGGGAVKRSPSSRTMTSGQNQYVVGAIEQSRAIDLLEKIELFFTVRQWWSPSHTRSSGT